jgi:hypothetical protein
MKEEAINGSSVAAFPKSSTRRTIWNEKVSVRETVKRMRTRASARQKHARWKSQAVSESPRKAAVQRRAFRREAEAALRREFGFEHSITAVKFGGEMAEQRPTDGK